MIITEPDLILIPFGSADFHDQNFSLAGFSLGGLTISTPVPHALVSRSVGAPLRFSNGPVQFILPRAREDLSSPAFQLALLKDNLERLCGEWQGAARGFVTRYLDDVTREIERARPELEARLRPFAGLYEVEHWIFSALMPLPRAHLHLPALPGAVSIDPDDLVRVDFAFWTGERVVAVMIDTGATVLPRRRRQLDRLARADLELVTVSKDDLADERSILDRLGTKYRDFWQDVPVPSGPFKGAAVMATIQKAAE